MYEEVYSASFHHKLELLQYNACLAITGAIRETSTEKVYQKLGWSPFSFGIGSENYVFSTRFIKIMNLVIFPI